LRGVSIASVDADDQAGDVVVAAGFVGCLDEAGAELIERGGVGAGDGGVEKALDSFVGELSGEAVGAEQEEVARLDFGFEDIGGHAVLGAEGAGDDVAQRRARGLGAGHAAEANLFLNEGVILGAELDASFAKKIATAVADVEYPNARLSIGISGQACQNSDQGSAHAAEPQVALRAGVNGLVGGDDGIFSNLRNAAGGAVAGVAVAGMAVEGLVADGVAGFARGFSAFADQAENFIDGQRAGDFSSGCAAHAITDKIDAVFDGVAEGVLVGCALAASVGNCGGCITRDGSGHKESPSP